MASNGTTSAEPANGPDGQWHLDKKVPLALIAAIFTQTLFIGIWVGTLSTRVSELETKAVRALDVSERVIRVEQDTIHIRQTLEQIEGKLDPQHAGR